MITFFGRRESVCVYVKGVTVTDTQPCHQNEHIAPQTLAGVTHNSGPRWLQSDVDGRHSFLYVDSRAVRD